MFNDTKPTHENAIRPMSVIASQITSKLPAIQQFVPTDSNSGNVEAPHNWTLVGETIDDSVPLTDI